MGLMFKYDIHLLFLILKDTLQLLALFDTKTPFGWTNYFPNSIYRYKVRFVMSVTWPMDIYKLLSYKVKQTVVICIFIKNCMPWELLQWVPIE
jgi:hypothetical protein